MPLPADYQSITVHGKWQKLDGSPESGSVLFVPSAPVLIDAAHATIIVGARGITVALDNNGEISIAIPATDDPDITGTPFHYNVTVTLSDYIETFTMNVPVATGGGTLEISTIITL